MNYERNRTPSPGHLPCVARSVQRSEEARSVDSPILKHSAQRVSFSRNVWRTPQPSAGSGFILGWEGFGLASRRHYVSSLLSEYMHVPKVCERTNSTGERSYT